MVLQLVAQLLHAHAAGERRIDFQRFLGDARRACPGCMCSSVRMLCSRSASLTSSTRMSLEIAISSLRKFSACSACLVTRSSFLILVSPSTSVPISGAEHLVDLGPGRVGVLDHVVQQRRRDRGVVELQLGEDRGDFERVRKIGIARGALLVAVRLHGIDVGAVEQRLVRLGIVREHPLDQFILPHHRSISPAQAMPAPPAMRRA